jgi:hypothetical protein
MGKSNDLPEIFVPAELSENLLQGGLLEIPNKRYKAEQNVTLLREIGMGIASRKTTPQGL